MTEGVAVLICLRVDEDSISSVVAGSTQDVCAGCDSRVWVSKSGQDFAKTQEVIYRCLQCTAEAVRENPEVLKGAQAVPGAVEEILEHAKHSKEWWQ